MPFLFVDYDQGAGGEFFCAQLSLSSQCVALEVKKYSTGRNKVQDRFDQEFLKLIPRPICITPHEEKFELVPMHRCWHLAKHICPTMKSIRISNPEQNSKYWQFLQHNRLKKVLMTSEPEPKFFIGYLKILAEKSKNKDFLRLVRNNMDNLTLQMLADNIEPTQENRKKYLEKIMRQDPEPKCNYDLVIPYEKLFTDTSWVQQQIKKIFGIEITTPWLETYQIQYETYNKTS